MTPALPTAQPEVDEVIATEFKPLVTGLVSSLVQVVPFQRRITPLAPTAQPSVLDTIATALSGLVVGVATLLQVVPFQRKITLLLVGEVLPPTAQPSTLEVM